MGALNQCHSAHTWNDTFASRSLIAQSLLAADVD